MANDTGDSAGAAPDLWGLKHGDPQAIERLWADYFQRLVGLYVPTSKNQLVADLYTKLGFAAPSVERDGAASRWQLDLAKELSLTTLVRAA